MKITLTEKEARRVLCAARPPHERGIVTAQWLGGPIQISFDPDEVIVYSQT